MLDKFFISKIIEAYDQLMEDKAKASEQKDPELIRTANCYYDALFALICSGLIECYLKEKK